MVRKINIRKRTEPRYRRAPYLVECRLPGGRRKSKFFPRRKDAEAYKAHLQLYLNPHLASTQAVSFTIVAHKFLNAKPDISSESAKLYQATFRRFVDLCGDPRCDEITPIHIDNFIDGRLTNKDTKKWQNRRQPRNVTINKDLRHLGALFRWATRRGYILANPLDRIDKLKTPKKRPKSWTPAEFAAVLPHLPQQWQLIALLTLSGIRKGLLVSLTRQQVDLEHGTIIIPEQKRQPERVVPIHPHAAMFLRERIASLPENEQRVFPDCKFSISVWVRACARAGVPRLKFHDLRTCVSTWLKQQGFSGDVVAKLFGHSTPTLTYQIYTDLDDLETRRKAVLALPLPG